MKEYKYIVANGCSYTQGSSMCVTTEGKLRKDYIPTPIEELPIEYQCTVEELAEIESLKQNEDFKYVKKTNKQLCICESDEKCVGVCQSLQYGLSQINKDIGYQQAINRYSRKLADKLNCEEINIATGGGSNDRLFRRLFNWIENNEEKVKDSVFVVGLTHWARKDLYSVNRQDYIISTEIWQDFDYIAEEVNCKQEEVEQWRDFELKYLTDTDEIEKKVMRECVLFDSLITQLGGDVVFFNALRVSNIIHPKLNFLQFDSNHYKGYNWVNFILKNDPSWDRGHPLKQHHHQMADILYEFINKTFGGGEH